MNVGMKSQKGAIKTSFVERGKERGLVSVNGNLKDITPMVLTCIKITFHTAPWCHSNASVKIDGNPQSNYTINQIHGMTTHM